MSSQHARRIVIFDTEFTTWDGARDNGWTGRTPSGEKQHREIVQIGAIKVDWPSGTVVSTFDQFVKPLVNPDLSPYFTNLTGITQEQVDTKGVSFAEALENFLAFIGEDGPLYSYGNDIGIMGESVALNQCNAKRLYAARNCAAINLNYFINQFDPASRSANSGTLAAYFGVADRLPPGSEHNAVFDCYSILAALLHMREQGAFLPI